MSPITKVGEFCPASWSKFSFSKKLSDLKKIFFFNVENLQIPSPFYCKEEQSAKIKFLKKFELFLRPQHRQICFRPSQNKNTLFKFLLVFSFLKNQRIHSPVAQA